MKEGGGINLGSGREISVGELVDMIGGITGAALRVDEETERKRPPQSEVERLLADHTRAREWLGWEPSVSLEDGLARTVAWIKEHPELYRAEGYVV